MEITSITFIKQGEEPVHVKTSKNKVLLDRILAHLEKLPPKQSLKVELVGKSFQPIMSRLRENLDDKKYEVYRVKNQVVIKRV